MLNGLQPWHLIILVLVVVLLFGAKRLPDAARSWVFVATMLAVRRKARKTLTVRTSRTTRTARPSARSTAVGRYGTPSA